MTAIEFFRGMQIWWPKSLYWLNPGTYRFTFDVIVTTILARYVHSHDCYGSSAVYRIIKVLVRFPKFYYRSVVFIEAHRLSISQVNVNVHVHMHIIPVTSQS